ncbi:MAG: UTP--glucose-1-phosphate uridylyltransferase [Clostridia bacterium]|nr:UTP--glucose-1-phosphate uridylyltransferase [Deltaproteobacteria bacterium]
MSMLKDVLLQGDEQRIIDSYGFDRESFDKLAAELAAGRFPAARNQVTGKIEAVKPGDIIKWPTAGSQEAQEAERLGRQAIAKGQVAVAVLNGGMATRFGGMVKCLVKVVDEHTFLDVKLGAVRALDSPVAVFLMNSFATEPDTRAYLTAHDYLGIPPEHLHLVAQHAWLRLTPDGKIYRDDKGNLSLCAPGHGDIFEVLADSPAFQRWVHNGGKYVLVSNVDNLAATLAPKVIGVHIKAGKRLTVEVTAKDPGDQGGAPVRVDGHLEIVEGFRFPNSFKQDQVPVFNCNTFVINAEAVRNDIPLNWFRADKKVNGDPVVQFERLMGEVTAFEDMTCLEVPRGGDEGRFLPVKTPDDLNPIREIIRARFLAKK